MTTRKPAPQKAHGKPRVRKTTLKAVAQPVTLSYQAVVSIRERFDLSRSQVAQLFSIPVRTQYRYENIDPLLAPAIADRVERFERIYRQAVELFEDESEAQRWLTTPKSSLEDCTPLVVLSTDQGARKVEQILYQAEYGIFG